MITFGQINIKDFPFTEKQKELRKIIKNNIITLIKGAAGTGKTTAAIDVALRSLQKRHANKEGWYKIVIIKPTVQAGTELGYLKGTLEEKTDPYLGSYKQVFERLGMPFPHYAIKFEPIQFLRGTTFEDCFVVVDEAQNCTMTELDLIQTRIGSGCKMVFLGDMDQTDNPKSGYDDFYKIMQSVDDGIGTFEFGEEDIKRHPLIGKYLKAKRQYFDTIQER